MKTCRADCERTDIHGYGYCRMHYKRLVRRGALTKISRGRTEQEKAEIVREYLALRQFMSSKEASEKLGVKLSSVNLYLRPLGLGLHGGPIHGYNRSYPELLDDYWELRDQGESKQSASRRLGVTERTVERALKWARESEAMGVDC